MKITLRVDGQEITISEKKLKVILHEHLSQFSKVPTEGKWFLVDPMNIDQKLFQEKRQDSSQEKVRLKIISAFEKVKEEPEKYGRKFKTMKPRRTQELKDIEQFEEFAQAIGDHIADDVEQVLEWAQRISNGEDWKEICNKPDTSDWHRLIRTFCGSSNFVGGSRERNDSSPAAFMFGGHPYHFNPYSVPLIVAYVD